MKTLLILLLAAAPSSGYTLRYKVAKPDAGAILARLEASTGLQFSAKCAEADAGKPLPDGRACEIQGSISTGPGYVVVEVFERVERDKRARKTKVTPDMKKKISRAVLGL